MQTEIDSYFVANPVAGQTYKLWSLPVGTQVTREGFHVNGRLCGPFTITRQLGASISAKTSWGYDFVIGAAIEATVV